MADTLYQGDDRPLQFAIPADLTDDLAGSSFTCAVQQRGGTPVQAVQASVDPVARLCWAWLGHDQTAAMVVGGWYGDGRLKLSSGRVHTIGTLSFTVADPVTPEP